MYVTLKKDRLRRLDTLSGWLREHPVAPKPPD
jgi:hypothetical protein